MTGVGRRNLQSRVVDGLPPELRLLGAILLQARSDALYHSNPKVRAEAWHFLRNVAPTLAQSLEQREEPKMTDSVNKLRTQQLLNRQYGNPKPVMQRVTHPDGSESLIQSPTRTLTGEETSRHWQEQADEEERQRLAEEARVQREANQQALASYKADMEAKWRQAGGTGSDFDELWPQLRKKWLLEKIGLHDLIP